MIHIPAEEKPHVITCVWLVVLRLLRSNKDYIRILILYNINYPLIHNTDQLAPVFLLEPLHIAEPADRIPKRTDRNLYHHLFVPDVKIMSKERLFTSFFTAVPYIFEIVIFVLLFELALIVFLNYPFPVFPFR